MTYRGYRIIIVCLAVLLSITLLLICASVVRSSPLEQTDTPTPTSTPTHTPTPLITATRYYSSTPPPVSGSGAITFPDLFMAPQETGEASGFELTCPSFPEITLDPFSPTVPSFPEITLNPFSPTIPSFPTFTMQAISLPIPSIPTLTLNHIPDVPDAPTFTLDPFSPTIPSLPPITLPVPSLPTTYTFDPDTTTITVTLPFSIVFDFTTITESWHPLITRGQQLRTDVESDVLDSTLMDMEIAGYTADEMASELVYGMDTTFSYLRAITDIGVLGPTVTTIIIGLGWIAFITFGKLLFKVIIVLVDLSVAILRIVIDVIIAILNALDLIPFI